MVSGAILIASAFVWLVAIVLGLTIFAALLPLLLKLLKWGAIAVVVVGGGLYLSGSALDGLGLNWREAGNFIAVSVSVVLNCALLIFLCKWGRDVWRDSRISYSEREAQRRKALGYDE